MREEEHTVMEAEERERGRADGKKDRRVRSRILLCERSASFNRKAVNVLREHVLKVPPSGFFRSSFNNGATAGRVACVLEVF